MNISIMLCTFATLDASPRTVVLRRIFLGRTVPLLGMLSDLLTGPSKIFAVGGSVFALILLTRELCFRNRQLPTETDDPDGPGNIHLSCYENTRRLQTYTVLFWWTFAFPFVLRMCGVISVNAENFMYAILDLCIKSMHIEALSKANFSTWQEREIQAHKLREQALHAEAQRLYVAYVFHEVRNPLNGIAGFLQNIEANVDCESHSSLRQDFECMQHCVSIMRHLLDNSLDLAKLEEKNLSLKYDESHQLSQFLEQTTLAVSCMESSRDCQRVKIVPVLEKEASSSLEWTTLRAYFDKHRLSQVLINLLTNALRHTKNGFVKLRVAATENSDVPNRISVLFEVLDTGCGVPIHQQDIIFKRFQCAATGYERTGLGLNLSWKLVELMGGCLKVESPWRSEATGSRLFFSLDMLTEVSTNTEEGVTNEEVIDDLVQSMRSWRCVVCDDQKFNRTLMTRKLQTISKRHQLDWVIDEVSTGEELLECTTRKVAPKYYNLLIIDEHMDSAGGKLKGTEVIQQLKKLSDYLPDSSVMIICSGNCTSEELHSYLALGADLAFGKPTPNTEDIVSGICTALSKRKNSL